MAIQFIVASLNNSSTDPVNNIIIGSIETPGNKIKKLSDHLLTKKDTLEFEESAKNLILKIHDMMIHYNLRKDAQLELFWSKIHKYVANSESRKPWTPVLPDSPIFASLFQFIVMQCVTLIMKHENESKMIAIPVTQEELKLTTDEQEVITYVAGYLIFSLQKKYYKMKQDGNSSSKHIAAAVLQFLDGIKVRGLNSIKAETFLTFTHKWIELRNRGGLVIPNDNMFIFVRTIENAARKTLNLKFIRTYRGQDLRDLILKELAKSNIVDTTWDSVSRLMPNRNLANIIKKQLINKWIDIKARSYVDTYVQLVKRNLAKSKMDKNKSKVKVSKKTEPAMRKKLT